MTLDLKNTIKIEIDWGSKESIELAERAKSDLENDGWVQIKHIRGGRGTVLIYAKEKDLNVDNGG